MVFTVPAMEQTRLPIADPGATPPAPPAGARYFARQPVVFRATAGWWNLLDFLAETAERHPAATLVALSVAPRPDSPDAHDVSFTLEWPVESERPAKKGAAK